MQVHLVGGFLGSGKTSAIARAAKLLMAQGQHVGIVTNDQGKYLVDTAFFRALAIPTVEVTGGCFCCNYDDFDQRLTQLTANAQPDVIFAESVGSCADVVATVLKPLLKFRQAASDLSVFADSRLLLARLLAQPLPFTDDVIYIFDNQIEESGLLVINKIDLLAPGQVGHIEALAHQRWADKPILLQNSLDDMHITRWLERIQDQGSAVPAPLTIDYARYGQGEAALAWLDQQVTFTVHPGMGKAVVPALIETITARLQAQGASIAHLKFHVDDGATPAKISLTTAADSAWSANLPDWQGSTLQVLINARVEINAEALAELVHDACQKVSERYGVSASIGLADRFHPNFPSPKYRLG